MLRIVAVLMLPIGILGMWWWDGALSDIVVGGSALSVLGSILAWSIARWLSRATDERLALVLAMMALAFGIGVLLQAVAAGVALT